MYIGEMNTIGVIIFNVQCENFNCMYQFCSQLAFQALLEYGSVGSILLTSSQSSILASALCLETYLLAVCFYRPSYGFAQAFQSSLESHSTPLLFHYYALQMLECKLHFT